MKRPQKTERHRLIILIIYKENPDSGRQKKLEYILSILQIIIGIIQIVYQIYPA
jgi:hypothetical protein